MLCGVAIELRLQQRDEQASSLIEDLRSAEARGDGREARLAILEGVRGPVFAAGVREEVLPRVAVASVRQERSVEALRACVECRWWCAGGSGEECTRWRGCCARRGRGAGEAQVGALARLKRGLGGA